jgi:hypothetical protein
VLAERRGFLDRVDACVAGLDVGVARVRIDYDLGFDVGRLARAEAVCGVAGVAREIRACVRVTIDTNGMDLPNR